jgi:hypothetical protein
MVVMVVSAFGVRSLHLRVDRMVVMVVMVVMSLLWVMKM